MNIKQTGSFAECEFFGKVIHKLKGRSMTNKLTEVKRIITNNVYKINVDKYKFFIFKKEVWGKIKICKIKLTNQKGEIILPRKERKKIQREGEIKTVI